jgi:hypothetical protein
VCKRWRQVRRSKRCFIHFPLTGSVCGPGDWSEIAILLIGGITFGSLCLVGCEGRLH